MVSKVLFASFLGLALAQTTVITLSVPGGDDSDSSTGTQTSTTIDPDNWQASVIAVSAGVTTLELTCQTKAGQSSDDDGGDFCTDDTGTFIYGPSTLSFQQSVNHTLVATANCPSLSSFHGTCTASLNVAIEDVSLTASSSIASVGPKDFSPLLVTVTAGADKLKATGSAGSSGTASQTPAASGTGSALPKKTGNAAAANSIMLGGSLLGAAAGVLGGLL